MPAPAETSARRNRLKTAAIIIAAWTLSAALTTTPAIMVDRLMAEPTSAGVTFAHVILGTISWMAATPLILWIGRRLPLNGPALARNIVLQLSIALAFTPAIVFTGYGLDAVILPWLMHVHRNPLWVIARAVLITSLFNIPTYVAVAAIGQAMAYLERYKLRERALARAQLQALRAQIHPHFLFNTMTAIATIGYRDAALADAALTRLASLLRTSLEDAGQEVTLRDEIAFVAEYLDLYQLLLADRLQVRFDIDAAAWNAAVPSMLLQPLVENAIVHGIGRRTEGGSIDLIGRVENARLVLAIRNDTDAARPAGDDRGNGLGLANVRERLRVLYGDAQRFRIDAPAPSSFRVTIELPARIAAVSEEPP
jgi:hypothetical protein